ncbi:excalibur calcium-binding domain-containing protein [Paenibacillus sp. LjRoot153]|uniref:excalibur calcium-binding domain-containing protein n=1 Tax=Paenibacillus sp. LjRoot153 TaxID=3342270 RepID=UPI003F4FCB27
MDVFENNNRYKYPTFPYQGIRQVTELSSPFQRAGFWILGVIFVPFILAVWIGGDSGSGTTSRSYYKNCTEAFSLGVSNIYRNEPGYLQALDPDHDGVACER